MKSISYVRKRWRLTQVHECDLSRRVGRKKEYPNRITLPLPDYMLAGIDASRFEGEDRVSMIREAIEREIKRREKLAKLKAD